MRFATTSLPEAALALKQGVGRLIRSEEDFGVVVICDPRMVGKQLRPRVSLPALPPMPVTRDIAEVGTLPAPRMLLRLRPNECAGGDEDPGAGYGDRGLLGRTLHRWTGEVIASGARARSRRAHPADDG